LEGIKNIIFDLGGVILNIDYRLTQQAFAQLGIDPQKGLYAQKEQSEIFDLLETGKISEAQFLEKIKAIAPQSVTEVQIIDAWNAMLLDFPLRRLQLLQQLQLHYSIYLLSNTNEIHEKAFNKILQSACGFPSLALFFDKVYLSHRIGLRKPSKEIFEFVLHDAHLVARETLFLDDSVQHIETANLLGIKTIHVTNGLTMEKDIFKSKN
jgi:glucose-1-phosphatase